MTGRRALVAGWFSFQWMGATAGDLLTATVVGQWLDRAGVDHDLALAPAFDGGVAWDAVDPGRYTDLFFVCGPCGQGEPLTDLLARFSHARTIGLNLSMLQPLDEWNPFDVLVERDSDRDAHPDLVFGAADERVPVVAVVLVHEQKEYQEAAHADVHAAIERLLDRHEVARLRIDTCFDPPNQTGLRTEREVASLVAKADAVVTTRLHGLVLALRSGVPALAVDPVRGGAKIWTQAAVLGWPVVLRAEEATDDALDDALVTCLAPTTRSAARAVAARAAAVVDDIGRTVSTLFGDAETS